jgi:hypothetical protein
MLYTKTDSAKYIAEFKTRFTNFAQKSPILLSFVVSDAAVEIIHENSGMTHRFEWDFTIPVKSFIHEIKQVLSDNHYPRIAKVTKELISLTPDEQATLIANGTSVDEVPSYREEIQKEIFKIDKVITLDDIIILQSERDYRMYRYKMNYSCIFFLRKYRQGEYKSLEEAGDFFFSKATLLNELPHK